MSELFKKKYRIPSARLQNWDYANEAMYFVTTCTKGRINYFGKIANTFVETQCIASLASTELGEIAFSEWYKTPQLRPDMNLELGEFVVMPNHIHGILMIGKNEFNTSDQTKFNDLDGDAKHRLSTDYKNKFSPQSKNLSSIVRGYKSAVTYYARKNNIGFNWQPRFQEHIIRSKKWVYQNILVYCK